MEITLWQMFKVWFWGHTLTGESIKKKGWKVFMPLYWINCTNHGYMTTTITGGRTLRCPACENDARYGFHSIEYTCNV